MVQNHNSHPPMENILKGIKAFVFDVDGVFTDGGILADLNGELYRTFDAKDSFAIRMAMMRGYKLGIITGGRSESIPKRFLQCGILPAEVVDPALTQRLVGVIEADTPVET